MKNRFLAILAASMMVSSPAIAEVETSSPPMDGSLIAAAQAQMPDNAQQGRQIFRKMMLSRATKAFDADAWAGVTAGTRLDDVVSRFGPPAGKIQLFESPGSDTPEDPSDDLPKRPAGQLYDYHYAGGVIVDVLFSREGAVVDKRTQGE